MREFQRDRGAERMDQDGELKIKSESRAMKRKRGSDKEETLLRN